jgi:hypothetical protein
LLDFTRVRIGSGFALPIAGQHAMSAIASCWARCCTTIGNWFVRKVLRNRAELNRNQAAVDERQIGATRCVIGHLMAVAYSVQRAAWSSLRNST